MLKRLIAVMMSLFLMMGVVQITAHTAPTGQTEEEPDDYFVYLPLIRQDYPPPVIDYFQADVEVANPGDTIELRWGTSDAVTVTLYHLLPTGQLGTFWEVAPTGTMSYTISPLARNYTTFMLFASNQGGDWVAESVQIILTCPDEWFFSPEPDSCPAGPAERGPGAAQPFEHGLMLWVQSQDLIYVLFADEHTPRWSPYEDGWEEGMAESDPTIIPPPGYYQPTRGFGLVWREQTGVRERLGWAVALEVGYETAVQRTATRYSDTYIRAADGNVWRLLPERSGWEKVFVTR